MTRHRPFPGSRLLLALAVGLALAGCQSSQDDASLIASAEQYLAKKEPKTAIVQLKNVLQRTPDSGQARTLLGKAFLQSGEASLASVELIKALELKHRDPSLLPALAEALILEGRAKDLVEQHGREVPGTPADNASFQASLAFAHAQLGDLKSADACVERAFAAVPDFPPARVMRARLLATDSRFDEALTQLDKVLSVDPKNLAALRVRGELLLYAKADLPAAAVVYQKLLELNPRGVLGHERLIDIHLGRNDTKAADAQWAAYKKVAPDSLGVRYYSALLALNRKDLRAARDLLAPVLVAAPKEPRALHLAAVLELKGGAYVQAETQANKILQAYPNNLTTLILIGRIQLESGQPAKAIGTLLPLLDRAPKDAGLTSLLAQAYMSSGDMKQAEAMFRRTAALDPADLKSRTGLALADLSQGKADAAYTQLEAISAADAGTTADLALVSALFQRKDFDRALKAIDALERKLPKNPLPPTLRGRVELARGDVKRARDNFGGAATMAPTYFPAAAALAGLDMRDGKPEDAKQRFEKVLAADPKNLEALLSLAELRKGAGAPSQEVAGLFAKAIQASPTAVLPRLLLIDHRLDRGEGKEALAAAQDGVLALPGNAAMLEALGRAQLATDDRNQALGTFTKLIELEPHSQRPHLRLAETYAGMQQMAAAEQSLNRALALPSDSTAAQRAMIGLRLAQSRPRDALTLARALQAQRPKDPSGFATEGDVQAYTKDWAAAAAAYRQALDRAGTPALFIKLHTAVKAGARPEEADKLAAAWVQSHPSDATVLRHLGDAALTAGQHVAAERYFAALVRERPEDAVALNNLAWLTATLRKPGAVDYAERSIRLLPNQPAMMDTLAMVLASENQIDKAITVQRKAVEIRPNMHVLRLHLAELLIKSGKKAEARTELEALAKLADAFPEQGRVTALMKQL